MKNDRGALAALLVLVLALGVSACGGGDSGESDEEKVEAALETALTSTAPAACADSRTIAFMEETTELDGAEAEAECERLVADREGLPSSIEVSKVEVGEGEATAEVAMTGGDPDGMVMEVALVEEDGGWKVDDFVDLVSLDRETFTGKLEKEFREEGLGAPEVTCLVGKLDEISQSDFEQLALGEDETTIDGISAECEEELEGGGGESTGGEEESAGYPEAIRESFLDSCLATSGNDTNACECSLDALESRFSVKELEEAETDASSGRIREMIEFAAEACA